MQKILLSPNPTNDEYNQEMKTLNQIKGQIALKIPNEQDEHRKKVKLRSLHHQLANEKVRLNDTIGENNELKVEINIMRKEILFAKSSIKAMEE